MDYLLTLIGKNFGMKINKLLEILVLCLFVVGTSANASEVVLVCKFLYGKHYYTNGTVEKFDSSVMIYRSEDTLFKINNNKKKLIEIRNSQDKIIKDVEWTDAAIEWSYEYDFNLGAIFTHKINRFNGTYIYKVSYSKDNLFYKPPHNLMASEWFEQCSKSKKIF